MKNWRSTLGGSLAAFGTFLFGAPVVMNATSTDFPKPIMVWCMVAGFVCQGLGIFFGHLFSADAKDVQSLKQDVKSNTEAIITGDTSILTKPGEPPKPSETKT